MRYSGSTRSASASWVSRTFAEKSATRCPFCPIGRLSFDSFYVWEHTNPIVERYFLVKDKLVPWQGRPVHLEIAVDITEQAERRKKVQRKFEIERTVVECVRTLMQEEDFFFGD